MWGGTDERDACVAAGDISIHPPRVGWDDIVPFQTPPPRYFNPPTPCGVGLICNFQRLLEIDFNPPTPCGVGLESTWTGAAKIQFQSTHPVWGGTAGRLPHLRHSDISIHPHRVGWDLTSAESMRTE